MLKKRECYDIIEIKLKQLKSLDPSFRKFEFFSYFSASKPVMKFMIFLLDFVLSRTEKPKVDDYTEKELKILPPSEES